jgi:hypothetical protein
MNNRQRYVAGLIVETPKLGVSTRIHGCRPDVERSVSLRPAKIKAPALFVK